MTISTQLNCIEPFLTIARRLEAGSPYVDIYMEDPNSHQVAILLQEIRRGIASERKLYADKLDDHGVSNLRVKLAR